MDPVQKAVMTHTFGPPMVKTKRPIISCNVCQIRFNSESQAEAHYKGNRHARRVKGIETSKTTHDTQSCPNSNKSPLTHSPLPTPTLSSDAECPLLTSVSTPLPSSPSPNMAISTYSADPAAAGLPETPSPAPSPSSGESEEKKANKLLYCSLCKVAVNSLSQLEAHNKGTKHKTILEARSGLGPIKSYPRLGPKPSPEQGGELSSDPNTQERTFHCEICNVRVISELQLKQVLGKLLHALINLFLFFSKELPKTLGAGLLPNPLAVAAVMAAAASSNQLALRSPCPTSHHHPHHHLLQGTPLSLLRPAPGPMRGAHGPILFTPY
uniref:Zinc finger protein 385A n=1 Tax=Cyclopterus lumpus TaxID=8103 RepID=A0A8C2XRD4_CYCLU